MSSGEEGEPTCVRHRCARGAPAGEPQAGRAGRTTQRVRISAHDRDVRDFGADILAKRAGPLYVLRSPCRFRESPIHVQGRRSMRQALPATLFLFFFTLASAQASRRAASAVRTHRGRRLAGRAGRSGGLRRVRRPGDRARLGRPVRPPSGLRAARAVVRGRRVARWHALHDGGDGRIRASAWRPRCARRRRGSGSRPRCPGGSGPARSARWANGSRPSPARSPSGPSPARAAA